MATAKKDEVVAKDPTKFYSTIGEISRTVLQDLHAHVVHNHKAAAASGMVVSFEENVTTSARTLVESVTVAKAAAMAYELTNQPGVSYKAPLGVVLLTKDGKTYMRVRYPNRKLGDIVKVANWAD